MNEYPTVTLPLQEQGSPTVEFGLSPVVPEHVRWAHVVLPEPRAESELPSDHPVQSPPRPPQYPGGEPPTASMARVPAESEHSKRLMHWRADQLADVFSAYRDALGTEQDGVTRYDQAAYIPEADGYVRAQSVASKMRSAKDLSEAGFAGFSDREDEWYFVPNEYLAADGSDGEIRIIKTSDRAAETQLRAEPVDPTLKDRIDRLADPSLTDLSPDAQRYLASIAEPRRSGGIYRQRTRDVVDRRTGEVDERRGLRRVWKPWEKRKFNKPDLPFDKDVALSELQGKVLPRAEAIGGEWLERALSENRGERARQLLASYTPDIADQSSAVTPQETPAAVGGRAVTSVLPRQGVGSDDLDHTRQSSLGETRAFEGGTLGQSDQRRTHLDEAEMVAHGWDDPRETLEVLLGDVAEDIRTSPTPEQRTLATVLTERLGEIEEDFRRRLTESIAGDDFDHRTMQSLEGYPDDLDDDAVDTSVREWMNLYENMEGLMQEHFGIAVGSDEAESSRGGAQREREPTALEDLILDRLAVVREQLINEVRAKMGLSPLSAMG